MRGTFASVLGKANGSLSVALAFIAVLALGSGQATAYTSVDLHARASQGYAFDLYAQGKKGSNPIGAGLSLQSDDDSYAAAFYSKRQAGGFDGRRLHADFGPYGTTSARFIKKKTHRHSTEIGPEGCRITEKRTTGVFSGHIDFEGENGFSAVHVSKARGSMFTIRVSKSCHGRVEAPEQLTPIGRLESDHEARPDAAYLLGTCGADPATFFLAAREHGAAYFEAGSSERVGRIGIQRFAFGAGPAAGFKLGEQGTRAMVRPGVAPFSGTGRFANHRLRGNLEVDLPGREATALTPGKGHLKPAHKVRKDLACYPFLGD